MKEPKVAVQERQVRAASLPPGHPDEFAGRGISPAQQVRVLLQRKKAAGITNWESVWPWAVARVRWPHDRDERHTFRAVIEWSEPYFRAAFENRGNPEDVAVIQLLASISAITIEQEDEHGL
jgi:hypothetical protein